VSNFLVVQAGANHDAANCRRVFRKGLDSARRLLRREPALTMEVDSCRVASFPRADGTPTPLVQDERTGRWLVAGGTWFHQNGAASGEESELLLRYDAAGAEALASELEGFFCIVIGDARSQNVVVITDIVGSFHVFVRQFNGLVTLSGSSLLLAGLDPCTLDGTGCQEFLRTGIVYEDRSFYRDVRKLGPARVYRFGRASSESPRPYWDVGAASAMPLDRDTAVKALWNATTNAGRRIARVFPRIVCDLTGGYDSRALVAAMAASGSRFETTVSGPPDSPDVTVSTGLARVAGLSHHVVDHVSQDLELARRSLAFTDGEFDLVEYGRILAVHSRLMKDYDVSLNGSFGEVARGYWWELLMPRVGERRTLNAPKIAARRFAVEAAPPLLIPESQRLDLVAHFASIIERAGSGMAGTANTAQLDNVYLHLRMQRWQGRIASSTNRLWPCLSPFMFRSVLEAMLAASPRVRRHGYLVRRMLDVHQPALARFPLEHGYPAVPFSIRTAHRFLPLIGHLGGKAWDRGLRKFGMARRVQTATNGVRSLAEQLLAQFDPDAMHLSRLYGRDTVQAYVRAQTAAETGVPASRVYSIESALQALVESDTPWTVD
jgi:asparagine synthase (glutamine-hydrolysing)